MLALLLAALVFQPSPEEPPPSRAAARPAPERPRAASRRRPGPRARRRAASRTLAALLPGAAADAPAATGRRSRPASASRSRTPSRSTTRSSRSPTRRAGTWSSTPGSTGNILLVLKLRDVPVEDALRAALSGHARSRRPGAATPSSSRPRRRPVERRPTLAGFDKPSGKRFTGEFEETDVDDALRQIAAAGRPLHRHPAGRARRGLRGLQRDRRRGRAARGARPGGPHRGAPGRRRHRARAPLRRVRRGSGRGGAPGRRARDARRGAGDAGRRGTARRRTPTRTRRDRVVQRRRHDPLRERRRATSSPSAGTCALEPGAVARDVVAVLGQRHAGGRLPARAR